MGGLETFPQPVIPTTDAHPEAVASALKDYHFYAVAQRRLGHGEITADDFRTLGGRLLRLCDVVYGNSQLVLMQNHHPAASRGTYNVSMLTPGLFSEIFSDAQALALRITPAVEQPGMRLSCAMLQWTRDFPRVLAIYARDGIDRPAETDERPLQEILAKKMFYVPDSAPNREFNVEFGLGSFLDTQLDP